MRAATRIPAALMAVLCCSAGIASADAPEGNTADAPEVQLEIEPREGLYTGDLLQLRITAEVAADDDITMPPPDLGKLVLHDRRMQIEPLEGGRQRFRFEIDLLALEPGDHEVPALRLRVVDGDGNVETITTAAQPIRVGSLLANEPDAQPKPTTEPVQVWQSDYTLLWILAALLAAILVAVATLLARRWWRRRQQRALPPPPPRPPREIALEKLDALKRERHALSEAGQHVELVDRASDAVREYLGAVHGFDGLESTTQELLRDLQRAAVSDTLHEESKRYLERCDLVKFAKLEASEAEIDAFLATAYELVREYPVAPEPVREQPGAQVGT